MPIKSEAQTVDSGILPSLLVLSCKASQPEGQLQAKEDGPIAFLWITYLMCPCYVTQIWRPANPFHDSNGRMSLMIALMCSISLVWTLHAAAAGEAGLPKLRPALLRGITDSQTSEDQEFQAFGGMSEVMSKRWEVVPEAQSSTREGVLQTLEARYVWALGDGACGALQVEVPPNGCPNIKSMAMVRGAYSSADARSFVAALIQRRRCLDGIGRGQQLFGWHA